MADLRSWGSKLWDQVNPFDNGRTFKQATPQKKKQGSIIQQATHNGVTNAVGNMVVKPVVNTAKTVTEIPRYIVSAATNNQPAQDASFKRLNTDFHGSIPGFIAQQGTDTAKFTADLAFRAPTLDLMGQSAEAQRIRQEGLQAFNRTLLGSAARPAEFGITNLAHATKQQQAQVGLDPNATGAQKWVGDPAMGAAALYGLAKGSNLARGGKTKTATPDVPVKTPTEIPKPGEVNMQPAFERQTPTTVGQAALQNRKGISNIPDSTFNADTRIKASTEPIPNPTLETPAFIRRNPDQAISHAQANINRIDNQLKNIGTPQSQKFNAKQELAKTLQSKPGVKNAAIENYKRKTSSYSPAEVQQTKNQLLVERRQYQSMIDQATKSKKYKTPSDIPALPGENAPVKVSTKMQAQVKTAQSNATKPTTEQKPISEPDLGVFTGTIKEPGKVARAWQSVNGVLSQYGEAGKDFVRRAKIARDNSEIMQQAFLDSIPTVQKLKNNDFTTFVQALDVLDKGGQISVKPKIQQAINEWQQAIPGVRDAGLKVGLDIGDLGPNYFPRIYKDLQKGKNLDRMAQELVDSGKYTSKADAYKALHYMRQQYVSKYGNLEHSRKLDLKGYEMTHDALNTYIANAFDRITKAEQFGPKGEIIKQIKNAAEKDGFNIAENSNFDKFMKIALGDVDRGTLGHQVSSTVRKFNALRSLGTAGVSNATQSVNTATIAGVGRTVKGIYKFATDANARRAAQQTGVTLDHSLSTLSQQGLGVSGKITRNLASPFFRTVEKFNRQSTAIVGSDWGNALAKKVSKGDTKAEAVLREKLGITGEIGPRLTRKQEIQASRALVEKAQFKVDPMDIPGWADSPLGKMAAQFRTFGYKQTDFMWNQILREATKGNFLPLARFITVGAPAGVAALTIKGALKRSPMITSDTNNAQKAIAGLSQVGGGGLPGSVINDISNGIKYKDLPSSLAGTVGGPTASFTVETSKNISKGQSEGDWTKLKKQGLRSIPAAGPAIANTIYPKTDKLQVGATDQQKSKATPAELNTLSTAEKKDFQNKFANSYGLNKLSNGKYVYTLEGDNSAHEAKNLQEARDAIAIDALVKSGDSYKIVGNNVYKVGEDGKATKTTKIKYEHDYNKALLTVFKDGEDYGNWLKTANSQLDNIQSQLNNDKTLDPLERIKLGTEATKLKEQIAKYNSYGGAFKKGSSGGSGGGGNSGFSLSGIKGADTKVKAPSGVAIRVPAAPKGKTTTLKKQSVNKISSNYLSKKLK